MYTHTWEGVERKPALILWLADERYRTDQWPYGEKWQHSSTRKTGCGTEDKTMENPPEMCNTGAHAVQMSEHTRNKNDPPVVSKVYLYLSRLQTWVPPPRKGLENRYFTGDVAE